MLRINYSIRQTMTRRRIADIWKPVFWIWSVELFLGLGDFWGMMCERTLDPNPESLDVKYWNDQTFLRLMKARQGLKGGEACYYKPLRDMQW